MIQFINSRARKYRGVKNILSVFLTLLLIFQTLGPSVLGARNVFAAGPAAVNLGASDGFAIVAKTAITDADPSISTITGDIAINPAAGSAITGVSCSQVSGTIYSSGGYTGGHNSNTTCAVTDPATALAVRSAMETAYDDAKDRTLPDTTEFSAGNLGGQTIPPGLHKWSTGVTIPTNVTLSGGANDVWIFQIEGDLSIDSATDVLLSGGAQASNVFWQVAGPTGATLGTTSTFEGTILSAKQIIIQTGATLNGRALAQTQVTLDGNTIFNSEFNPDTPPPPDTPDEDDPVATCLIPGTTSKVEDFEIGNHPAGEKSLITILDESGFGFIDVNNDQIDTQVWNIDPSFDIVNFKVTVLGKEAGNTEKFGYYEAGDGSTFSQVFSVPPTSVGSSFDVTLTSDSLSSVGFAIDTQGTASRKWFSETVLNNPSGQDNVAVYNPDDNKYVLAFEDLPNVAPFNYDGDFNDLVVVISEITCQTCETTEGSVVSDTSVQDDEGDASALTFIHSAWTADIPGATWIWSTDPISNTTTTETETFTKTFNVNGTPESGTLDIASDNFYKVWVNDVLVGEEQTNENNFQLATQDNYDVTSFLVAGSNTIKIEATNKGVEESNFESNPAGVLFKLNWTAKNCGNDTPPPPPPDDEEGNVNIKFHKFIDGDPATEESANGVEFGIEWGNGQTNGNTFNLTSTDYTHTLVVEESSSLSWGEITDLEGPILPLQSQCTEGNFVLLGYTYGDTLEDAINAKANGFLDPSLNDIYGDKFVIVWNKTCEDPTIVIEKYGSYDSTTGEITFSIDWEVTDGDVRDFVITDNIPSGTTYVNNSADNGGSFSDPTVTWNLGSQSEGALGTVSFNVTVDSALALNMWASGSEDNNQGTNKNGTAIVANRTIPSAMFGPAETTGTPFDSVVAGSFFSLGFTGGNIVVTFDNPVFNGAGNDTKVFEVTGGSSYPDEKVKVEGWDGSNWVDLGTVTRDGEVDLGILSSTNKIRLTDASDINLFEPTADGYDVDAVKALHLLPEVCSIENLAEASAIFGEDGELSASSNATIFVNESVCNNSGDPDDSDGPDGPEAIVTDPAIVKTVSEDEPFPGETIQFTLEVSNNSSIEATNITVEDPFPVGITYTSDDAVVGADTVYDSTTRTLTWTIPSIAPNSSVTLIIDAEVEVANDFSGDLSNTARITGGADEGNSDTTNDSSTAPVVVFTSFTGGCGDGDCLASEDNGGGGGGDNGGGGGLSSHRRGFPEVLGAFNSIIPDDGEVLGAFVGLPNTGRGELSGNSVEETAVPSSSATLFVLGLSALLALMALNFVSIKVLNTRDRR